MTPERTHPADTYRPEFDHPFRVNGDGTVTDCLRGHYAPELFEDDLTPGWSFASTGYTGQYGYRGPVMHDSETFSGRLRDDVMSEPGVYCLVVCYYADDDADDGLYLEGWAVARHDGAAE